MSFPTLFCKFTKFTRLISFSQFRSGSPVIGIPLLGGKWEGKLNRIYNMSISNKPNNPFQDFVFQNFKIQIILSKDSMRIQSLVNATFLNTLPISIAPQDVDFNFWIFHNMLPVLKFEYFAGDFGLALVKDKNSLFANSSFSIVNAKSVVEILKEWLDVDKARLTESTPTIELKEFSFHRQNKDGNEWKFIQSIVSGLSFSFQIPKIEPSSHPFDASIFNVSMKSLKCSAKTNNGIQVTVSGILLYENPFFFFLGPDQIWLSLEAWIFFKGLPIVQIISTESDSFKVVHGKNEQAFHISVIVQNVALAMELFSQYAEGQASKIEIGNMSIRNSKETNWYWMNGMLDSLLIPITIPGAKEDEGEPPLDCDSNFFSALFE